MKSVLPLLFISMVGATSAFGQAPILSDSAESQTMPSDECLSRAERAFRDLGYNPVRYPSSVFADRGNDHFVIRCSHSHLGVIFLAGAQTQPMRDGGPGTTLDRLKAGLRRR